MHVHYDLRKYIFFITAVSVCSSLPDKVVTANTVNSFNNRLDKFWAGQEVKFNWKAELVGNKHKYLT